MADCQRGTRLPGWRCCTGCLAAIALMVAGVAAARPQQQGGAGVVRLPGLLSGAVADSVLPPVALASAAPRPAPVPQSPPPSLPTSVTLPTDTTRTMVLTLHDLGAAGPVDLRGHTPQVAVTVGVRADEVVTAATLTLSGAMSPALLPGVSGDTITLNGHYVGSIAAEPGQARFDHQAFALDPVLFRLTNRLGFHFAGRTGEGCRDATAGLLWSSISDRSTLALTLERLPPRRDLALLPLPFLDAHETTALDLPVILPSGASNEAVLAAGIVASWFGALADPRGASFPVVGAAPAKGDAVLVVIGADAPGDLVLPTMGGATLAVIPNPNDPAGSLLLVGGRTGAEAVAAATALALGSRVLGGAVATVRLPDAPYRRPYDAPAWLPTDRPVQLGTLVDPASLQGTGAVPGMMRVPFRTAPDLDDGGGFAVWVRFRAPPGRLADLVVSHLDVGLNGRLLSSLPLAGANTAQQSWLSRLFTFGITRPGSLVTLPGSSVSAQNELQFFFDTQPKRRADCTAVAEDLREAVDPDSTIDLRGAERFAELPNLAWFANAGFPFTRLADLADTAVVLPAEPDAGEISAFLGLMGRFGAFTGYPVIHLAVVRPAELGRVAGRNMLLLGTLDHLGAAAELLRASPFRLDGDHLRVRLASQSTGAARWFGDPRRAGRDGAAAALEAAVHPGMAALVGAPSPTSAGKSVVALVGGSAAALQGLVAAMSRPEQAAAISGDLALLTGDRVTSYRVGERYAVGNRPFWREQVAWVVAGVLVGCAMLALRAWRLRAGAR